MNSFDITAKGRERCERLVGLARQHFPRDVPSNGRHDDWGVTGPALLRARLA